MPEGDTIHRAAARLRPALAGRPLRAFRAPRVPRPHPRPGPLVDRVDAVGKHLLVRFGDGWVLDTHLRMTGSWHLYRTGERWRQPAHLARAVIEVDGWVAVCFSAPVVRLSHDGVRSGGPPAVPALGHLGPDLCRTDVDLDEVVRRMAAIPEPGTAVAEVLLDQRVAAGVGNVFKSEVLFACRVDPFVVIDRVDHATRRRLAATAARMLQANLGPGPRTTAPGPPGSLAVYGRQRQPCPRCGSPVRMTRRGPLARSTYWCPTCQPSPS